MSALFASQRASVAVVAAWLLLGGSAAAGDPVAVAGGPVPVAQPASAEQEDAEVRRLFAAGDYAAARVLVERAYTRTREPRLAFNLAVIHHHLGNCEAARDLYREYLQHDPVDPGRSAAQRALADLAPYCADASPTGAPARAPAVSEPMARAQPSTPAPAAVAAAPSVAGSGAALARAGSDAAQPAPPFPAQDRERESLVRAERWIAWSLLGAGAVAGVGSLWAWREAASSASELQALARRAAQLGPSGVTYDDCCGPRSQSLESSVHGNETWSRALGLTSALLLGSGVTLWLLDSERSSITVQHGSVTRLDYRLAF